MDARLNFAAVAGLASADVFAEAAPSGTGMAVSGGQLAQVLLGLLAVLALILLFAWLARNVLRIQPAASGGLRVLGGLSLGSREKVVLLQVGEQQLVLGVAPGRISKLHVLDKPLVETSQPATAGVGFASLFSRFQAGGAGTER